MCFFLSKEDIDSLDLSHDDIMDSIELGLEAHGETKVIKSSKDHLPMDYPEKQFNILKGYVRPLSSCGVKVIGDFQKNYEHDMPSNDADFPETGAPAIGGPDSAICIAACAQLARRYNLPCRGGGALTDSPLPYAQRNCERMFTLLWSALCGVNYLMRGAGILESYLTMSYEQLTLDLDLIATVRSLVNGINVSDDSLALNTIYAVGPGGMFLDADHLFEYFRGAFFSPRIGIWQSLEQWQA